MERPLKTQVDALAAGPNARRRLIRGAFAAPAIMTVCSGRVFAASNLNCIVKQTTFPGVTTSLNADTFKRTQVYKIGSKFYVLGLNIVNDVGDKASGYITTGQVHEFFVATNQTAAGLPITAPSGTAQAQQYWAALRFDASGRVVGVGSGVGYGVTGSCWGSFA